MPSYKKKSQNIKFDNLMLNVEIENKKKTLKEKTSVNSGSLY
jgi:hypothetical protein